jgi:hypothetical protein
VMMCMITSDSKMPWVDRVISGLHTVLSVNTIG